MLINTINDFVKIIPTADGTEFDAIQPFLVEAESQLKGLLLGEDLFNAIAALSEDSAVKLQLKVLVANTAYHDAIPYVDMIQTANGFAVVSNSNMAPASKERVERLIKWVGAVLDRNIDILINHVYRNGLLLAEWKKFSSFNDLVNCFFFTGSDFAFYAKVTGNKREQFEKEKGRLIAWQENILAPIVSKAYLAALISQIRDNMLAAGSPNVIHYCKMILAQLIEDNQQQAEKLCNALANILDSNLETYATYASSEEYALKTAAKYENKSDDKAFFFGL